MGTFLGELGRRAVVKGIAGLTLIAGANEVCKSMQKNSFAPRIPFASQTPAALTQRLPDPRAVQNQQEQISTMERLNENLKEYLAPLTAEMEKYDVRVQSPMLLRARRSATVEHETLEAFLLPSQNAHPLTEFTLKKGNMFAYDAHVAILNPDGTESFWAITYNSIAKHWVFRVFYETTTTGGRNVFAKENP